jgi:hypothetical protein
MKKAVFLGLGLLLAARSFAGVFISEYIEGVSPGVNKAIEIYNGTAAPINMMSDYRLGVAYNGAAVPTMYQFNRNVAAGDVYVVANSSADAAILAVADTLANGFANWNGNDFVGLYQMVAGSPVLIDAIGILGNNPGTAWAVAGVASGTMDHTLVRKVDVTQGTTNWALSAGTNTTDSQWIVNAVNTFSYLGSHFMDVGLPIISNMSYAPANPNSSQTVTASADVTDNGTLTSVMLHYTVNGGTEEMVAMTLGVAPSYSGDIPPAPDNATVVFHVEATDNEANTTVGGSMTYEVHDTFPCVNIASVRANDANGSPLLLGQVRSVCGVVTATTHFGTSGPVYLTHATGSVCLYGAGFLTGVTIGDEIQATGTVGFYNGLTEFTNPTFLNIVGHPGEPAPVATDLATLNAASESWEAQFVHLEGLELDPAAIWPAANTNGSVLVWQGADSFTMFVDRDTDLDGSPAPTGTFNLNCLVGQYDNASPYDAGYQLLPRGTFDFTFVGNQPPSISGITRVPYVPTNTQSVAVTALVVDDVALVTVDLYYQVNGGGYGALPMSVVSGDTWGATIPAQAVGALVDYYIEATDATDISTSATSSYTVYETFPCTDIATIHANDPVGQPLMLGQTVYLCGTLTCGSELGVGGPFYITGPTGSMALFGGAFNTSTAVIGDEIEAVGTVGFYNGLTEITNSPSVVVTGHPGEPAPLALTIAALNAAPESYESQFVRLDNCTLVDPLQWPLPGANADLLIAQGADQITMHIDRDTNVDESAAPVGPFSLKALVGQYDTATPWDAGYQVTPRMASDIMTAPAAPVVSIAYLSPNVVLSWPAVPGATDYVVHTAATGYGSWDAGVSTGGATSFSASATGKAFYYVMAVN